MINILFSRDYSERFFLCDLFLNSVPLLFIPSEKQTLNGEKEFGSLTTLSSRVLVIFETCYFVFCCSPSLSSTSQFWLYLKITHWKCYPSRTQTKKGRESYRKLNKSTLLCFPLRLFFFFVIWKTRHLSSYY